MLDKWLPLGLRAVEVPDAEGRRRRLVVIVIIIITIIVVVVKVINLIIIIIIIIILTTGLARGQVHAEVEGLEAAARPHEAARKPHLLLIRRA